MMALLECDIAQNMVFLRPKNGFGNYQRTHSESSSPQNNYKGSFKLEAPLPSITTIGHQLTTGLSPHARRMHVSSSATVSPKKSIILPKRLVTSASNSPCFNKKRNQSATVELSNSNNYSSSKSSFKSENGSNCSSSQLSTNLFTDGLFDFNMCERCSKLCPRSLDLWIDHLGDAHPIPLCWPSSRVEHLNEYEQRHPYTSVVGSNKKRKADAVPRPLNSFMIFAQYLRRVVLHWFPDAPNVHISQRVGQLWRKLDAQMREKYVLEAYRLQHLHSIEFPHYKYQPKKRTRGDEHTVSKANDSQTCAIAISDAASTNKSSTVVPNQGLHTSSNDGVCYSALERNAVVYWDACDQEFGLGTINKIQDASNVDNIMHGKSVNHKQNKTNKADHSDANLSQTQMNQNENPDSVIETAEEHTSLFVENTSQTDETLTLLVSGDQFEQSHYINSDEMLIPSSNKNTLTESKYVYVQSQSIEELIANKSLSSLFTNNTVFYDSYKSGENIPHRLIPIRTNLNTVDSVSYNSESNNFRSFTPSLSSISPVSLEFDNLSHSTQVESEIEQNDLAIKQEEQISNLNSTKDSVCKFEPIDEDYQTDNNHQYFDQVDSGNPIQHSPSQVYAPISVSDMKLEFPIDIQDMDSALSFNDIETCKMGITLDDLDEMTLFPNELTNDLMSIKQEPNTDVKPYTGSGMDTSTVMRTQSSAAVVAAADKLVADNLTKFSSLPCIESWTFEKFNQ